MVLSLITIIAVSLLTKKPTAEQLAAVRPAPIENYKEFEASVAEQTPTASAER